MTLIGMSKETYQKILSEVDEIRYLISLSGTLNNWPTIESILMERHNLTVNEVQTFINFGRSRFGFSVEDGPVWIADRPEPKIENYPEVAEFLRKK